MERKKNGWRNLILITQLGINVMTPIFLCTLAGVFLDRKFGTKTVLVFLILGVLSGGYSAYHMAKHTIDDEKRDREKEQRKQRQRWQEQYGTDDGSVRKENLRRARREDCGLPAEEKKKDGDPS